MVDLDKLIRPNILTLEPYRCARDDYKVGVLLDANENTHGPALTEVSELEDSLELNRYPDPHQHELKKNIVDFRNSQPNVHLNQSSPRLGVENLCLGVGSDESIDMLLRCVCTPGQDKLLTCPPTYGMYSICAVMNDVPVVKVPLTFPEFQLDVDAVARTVESDPQIKLVYLTSPGNPTGKLIKVDLVLDLLRRLANQNALVIVDEAYVDFTLGEDDEHSQSMSTLVNQYDNLVVFQTLSKSFGLAGIRLGITYCSKQLSYFLNAMKYPYNISSLTSSVALRATSTGLKVMRKYVDKIKKERAQLIENLSNIEGVGRNIGGLDSNFFLLEILDKNGVPSNELAHELYTKLASIDQVVVRFRGKELNCTGALRISVGTAAENTVLVSKFASALKELR
ncbi:histidinol-phosphate transaminase [Yamadazyma tenuis]|uniref:histidinol-phosphate transaminase n=1 Tax=Candida tenuis (strain ATCC 10573 / BCRC 21748 / CBS 615 / JCM 9827 / NBRC 10315 / NRRL Y-1498 / VKM Y-70) TaxID=590646 RepID=G3B794_CANTC|nr:histidinol-phosphate aminotransferase [Yamadazyma tenuis ATCC 10573]EGV61600.1 histidinol-phosphate aminotransferase [Yamadazyma tenuis ATCC 10573]WEJ92821.1 histidinol-phosphate transaminase [Yamadazyma tenuis]